MDKKQFEAQVLEQFEPLIHKTLNKLGIKRNNHHFEDYSQELRYKMIELAHKFNGEIFGKNIGQFISYAQRGLRWHAIDLIRKNKHIDNQVGLDVNELTFTKGTDFFDASNKVSLFISEAKKLLNDKEFKLLSLLLEGGYSLKEIGQRLGGVTTKTAYLYKKELQEKLTPLKYLLADFNV